MKRIWKIVIICIIILFILSFFSNDHGYITNYKKISGVYVEQKVEHREGSNIYKTVEVELPGLRKGLLKTRGDRVSNIFNDIGNGIENSTLFVIGCQEKDILYSIDMFVGIIYNIIDFVYNFLLLFTTGGEAILIFVNIPLIGNIIEWIIQLIVGCSGDILGEFLLIIGIIYLTKLFHRIFQKIFKKNKKGNEHELDNKDSGKLAEVDKTINNIKKSLDQTSKKQTFFQKSKTIFQKILKFIINKKTYFIISIGLLIVIILIINLYHNKNGIELGNKEEKEIETPKNDKCNNTNCLVNKGFEFYKKGDYYNAKQSFDNAFIKQGYLDQGTIDSNTIIEIIKAINDIYNISGFNEVSDGSYSGDVATEVYIDSINYGNYLIDIIKNSDDAELQEKSYNLLFELCDTVIDFDFMSSRRIYFNILDSLNGLIPENYRLIIYQGIISSNINGINNASTSENDKTQYFSEIETASYYALLLDDTKPQFYYYKGVAEYLQNKFEDAIADLETFLNMQDEYIGSSGSLVQTYLNLGLSYLIEGYTIEQKSIGENEKATKYFEKAENIFKKLVEQEKTMNNYLYLGAACIKKVNNLIDYNIDDYEICCNYLKEGMILGLDTNGTIYEKHSKYCKKINRALLQQYPE